MISTRPSSIGMDALPAHRLGEEQVVGRVQVQLQDPGQLHEPDVRRLGQPRVTGAAVAAERGVDDVRRVEQQGVGPAPVAVGDQDDAGGSSIVAGGEDRRRGQPA